MFLALLAVFGCFLGVFSVLTFFGSFLNVLLEFYFGFSSLLSDCLQNGTLFEVFYVFLALLAVFGCFLGVFRAFLMF